LQDLLLIFNSAMISQRRGLSGEIRAALCRQTGRWTC